MMSATPENAPRGRVRRLGIACVMSLVFAWLILRWMWIYVWRGEAGLEADMAETFADWPCRKPPAPDHVIHIRVPAHRQPTTGEGR